MGVVATPGKFEPLTYLKYFGIAIGVLTLAVIIYEIVEFMNSPAMKGIAKLLGTAYALAAKVAQTIGKCLSGNAGSCAILIFGAIAILGAGVLAKLLYATASNKLLEKSRDAGVTEDEMAKDVKDAAEEAQEEGGTEEEIEKNAVDKFAEKHTETLENASVNDPSRASAVAEAKAQLDESAKKAVEEIENDGGDDPEPEPEPEPESDPTEFVGE